MRDSYLSLTIRVVREDQFQQYQNHSLETRCKKRKYVEENLALKTKALAVFPIQPQDIGRTHVLMNNFVPHGVFKIILYGALWYFQYTKVIISHMATIANKGNF